MSTPLPQRQRPDDAFERRGTALGRLVDSKNRQHGDSAGKTGAILAILYPDGIRPDQYGDVLLSARVLDKLSRIAQRGTDVQDLGGDSPWQDVSGYGLLGAAMGERR